MEMLFFLLLLLVSLSIAQAITPPYLSLSTTFHPNRNRMVAELRIFVYPTPRTNALTLSSPSSSSSSSITLFHSKLLESHFLTSDPNEAHLFYLPAVISTHEHARRSTSRYIRDLRSDFPFWNRTLGADNFFVSDHGVGVNSDRNLVELRKNSIQISPFPAAVQRDFIPHKDLTLPPPLLQGRNPTPPPKSNPHLGRGRSHLAFYEDDGSAPAGLLEALVREPEAFMLGKQLGPKGRGAAMSASRFCIVFYGSPEKIGETLEKGCVPVVVSEGPVVDLPFYDVIRWSEIAVFVRLGAVQGMRRALEGLSVEKEQRMREMGVEAGGYLQWRSTTAPTDDETKDAFGMIMYQLWLRRHVIRYSRVSVPV